MKTTIPLETQELNRLLKIWVAFFKRDTATLIRFLYSEGYSKGQIAKVLGKHPSFVTRFFK